MRLFGLGIMLLGFAQLAHAQVLLAPDQATINRLGLVFAPVLPLDSQAGAQVSATIISSPLLADSVHAQFSGTLLQWQVTPGDTVAADTVLGVLQSPEVLAVQQEYLQALASRKQAEAALERDNQLLADGIIAASRAQQTQRDAEGSRSAATSLAARLEQAGLSRSELASLGSNAAMLGQYQLRAPQDGVVGRLLIVPGSAVATGDELVTFNSANLWVEAAVPASLASSLVAGQSLQVVGVNTPAVLRQIDAGFNPRSQTIGIKAEFTGPVSQQPGQIMKLILSPNNAGWLVPAEAVVHNGDQTEVFVRTAAGIEGRVLELAPAGSDYLALSGLNGDEVLVVRGAALIKGISLGLGGE